MNQKKIVNITDSITVDELAGALNLPVTTLIGELFKNGIVATINQRIDFETATIIVEELGLGDVELQKKEKASAVSSKLERKREISENAEPRPPIVAVMGHVDHGKTTLLDTILSTKTVSGEAGGITQHISAYQTVRNGRPITLLDTPGHEAFAALRQHGATLTDVVVIVVAADDGVKPQTIEAIRFAQNANAKIVVAINKMDKDTANPDLVKGQLAERGLMPEEWGGDTIMVPISALKGDGIDNLLDMVLLTADMEELRADTGIPAEGLVIESHMEVGKGSVVSLLVEQGDIKQGDFLIAGTTYGKVRTLLDFKGENMKKAGPSTPVTVTGFKELPQFGDIFKIVKNEKEARNLAQAAKIEAAQNAATANTTSADLLKMMTQKRDAEDFNIVIKADVQGSLTSVSDSLRLIDTGGEVNLSVVGSGIGNITENDIHLAAAGENTIIYGFNVELPPAIKKIATRDRVEVRIYKVIYELLDDARQEIEKLLAPEVVEMEIGSLEVKGVFRTMKEEIIAGGEVKSGKVYAGLLARVIRKKEILAEVELSSVQRQQQEAKDVIEGEMCGLSLKTQKKIQLEIGDRLEFFTREVVARKLKG
ncbi:MAG: translation initiation factor IF-2 [bacterium]|nr:translation initiation factor IF-2 [bacterium]